MKVKIPQEFIDQIEKMKTIAPENLDEGDRKAFAAVAFLVGGRPHETVVEILMPIVFDVLCQIAERVEGMAAEKAFEEEIEALMAGFREGWVMRQKQRAVVQ